MNNSIPDSNRLEPIGIRFAQEPPLDAVSEGGRISLCNVAAQINAVTGGIHAQAQALNPEEVELDGGEDVAEEDPDAENGED